jgi:glutamyl-tRNA reductase
MTTQRDLVAKPRLVDSIVGAYCSVLTIKYEDLADYLQENEQTKQDMEENEARLVSLRLNSLKRVWQFAKLEEEHLRQLALHLEIEVNSLVCP